MAKVYAQVDPWFIQRGYKRVLVFGIVVMP